jgi:antitoxin FitA
MKSVTIRAVPDEVVAELATRAASRGFSLQEYLKGELVALSSRPDITYWMSQTRARKSAAPVRFDVDELLTARDADRR